MQKVVAPAPDEAQIISEMREEKKRLVIKAQELLEKIEGGEGSAQEIAAWEHEAEKIYELIEELNQSLADAP